MIPASIILHCSDTEDGSSNSWPAIRKYHMDTLGWKDIGYHYGIEVVGGRIVLQRGRAPNEMGAHCKAGGKNNDSLGVCVVGKFNDASPSSEIYSAVVMFLATLCFVFNIHPSTIYGHREWEYAKTCPGLAWDLDRVRDDVAALLRREPSITGLHLVL